MSIKKIAVKFVMLCVICITLLQFDNRLAATATQLTEGYKQQTTQPSPAFDYLVGFSAPETADVIAVGKRRIQSTLSGNTEHADKLPLPTSPALCAMHTQVSHCIADILKHKAEWQRLITDNKTLIQRYQTFITFDELATQYPPTTDFLLPDFLYLVAGHKLSVLNTLLSAEKGKQNAAIHTLITELTHLRRQLGYADTLITKVIYVAMIRHQLQTIALLKTKYNAVYDHTIPLLTQAEMDMTKPLSYEYGLMEAAFEQLNKNALPAFLLKTVFKRNMSLNQTADTLHAVMSHAHLPPHALATQLTQPKKANWRAIKLRNLLGSYLSNLSNESTYQVYVARTADLNLYIASVNYLLSDHRAEPTNPYHPTRTEVSIDDHAVCMLGLHVNKMKSRWQCMHIVK